MTDRVKGLTVVLEEDMRSDDIEPLLKAVALLKGVLHVETHVADLDDFVATERVRFELGEKIWKVLYDRDKK